jgi:hypothetical protein
MALVKFTEMCFKEVCDDFLTEKCLCVAFPIQIGPKQGGALCISPFVNFAFQCTIRNVHENQVGRSEYSSTASGQSVLIV